MYRLISAVICIILLRGLPCTNGYKWITLRPNDTIPKNAFQLSTRTNAYVGRARHYDEVLLAEVSNSSYALVYCCGKEIVKHKFEILVATERCEWKAFNKLEDVPDTIVRGGTTWDNEPIYIARAGDTNYAFRMASVLLTTNEVRKWLNSYTEPYALVCDDSTEWVDSPAASIPNNTISGGKSDDDDEVFVARIKRNCDIIPGEVIPDLGIAMALYQGNVIKSSYCQVLVGDSSEYGWVNASNGEIPDYAVPAGKKDREVMYVAKVEGSLGYIVHGEAIAEDKMYEVLIRN